MDELKITQQQGIISTNLDIIEAELKAQMEVYKDYVVTEDSVPNDKKLLAELRKLEKDLNSARVATKKEYMKAFDEFEGRCKSVISLVSQPIALINEQIKLFDEEKKIAKIEHIKELYAEHIGELERFLPFEKVMNANPKWANASTKDSDILFDLSAMVLKVKNDLSAIKALNSEIEEECIRTYESFGNDLSMAIQRNSQYLADKQKLEQSRKEEEARASEVKKETQQEQAIPSKLSTLDAVVKMTKTAKIIVAYEDLQQAKNCLDFADIKYQVIED